MACFCGFDFKSPDPAAIDADAMMKAHEREAHGDEAEGGKA